MLKIIVGIAKENMNNESLCENTGVLIRNIMKSLNIDNELNIFFLEVGGFSFALTLLERHSKNKIICKILTVLLKAFFLYVPKSETEKKLGIFIEANGIEIINKVLNEQACERNDVFNCVYICLNVSKFEGKYKKVLCCNYFSFAFTVNQQSLGRHYARKLTLSGSRK